MFQPGSDSQAAWESANPDNTLIFFAVTVERHGGEKSVTGSQKGWQDLTATPADARYWGRDTLVLVAPPGWVCVDVDDPPLAAQNVDVARLIDLSGGCHYITSTTDDGHPKRHIWFQYPDGWTGTRYRNTIMAGTAGIDILTGDKPRQVHVAGPGRTDPDSCTPGVLDEEVQGILDTLIERVKPRRARPQLTQPHQHRGEQRRFEPDDIVWMLDRINPTRAHTDYDEWWEIGAAIHSWDPTRMDLWDAWSARDPDRYDADKIVEEWGRFRAGGGITIGTLVHHAGEAPPRRSEIPVDDYEGYAADYSDEPPTVEDMDEPAAPKPKKKSVPSGKDYALRRPGPLKYGNLQNDYWTWGGSFRRCLLHLGYHIRHNTRAEQIEYLPIGGKRPSPNRIEKLARSTKPVKPMAAGWKTLTDDVLKRLSEKIRRYCYYEHLEYRKDDAGRIMRDKEGNPVLARRWTPINYGSGSGTYKAWRSVLLSAVSDLRIDPFAHYLSKLPDWDGTDRIASLLDTVFEVRGTPQKIAAAAAWNAIGGAVERTYTPGAEHHHTPILSGPGGTGKTKLWKFLVPDDRFYGEAVSVEDLKDPKIAIEKIGNSVFCEIAEVSAMSGKWDIERLKSVLTNPRMRARLAYAEVSVEHPCAHVFVATSNDDQPLPLDNALARRFIHVNVVPRMADKKQHPEGLFAALGAWMDENREQVWAEAVHRVANGEPTNIDEDLFKQDTLDQMYVNDDYVLFLIELEERSTPDRRWSIAEMRSDHFWDHRPTKWYDRSFAEAADRRGWIKERPRRERADGTIGQVTTWRPPPHLCAEAF